MAETRLAWRERPLTQLTLARFREFYREPEALFWTFAFPILMTVGLGIAFRSRPPETLKIGIVRGRPGAEALARDLGGDASLAAALLDDSTAARELRIGKIALLLVPQAGGVEYRFDRDRPEGVGARRAVDDAVQRAAGRRDPVPVAETLVSDRGARYIDFLVPGLLGMNLMANGIWGIGFTVVDQRRKKLLKRFIATPMSRADYLASFLLSRLALLVLEVAVLLGFGTGVFDVPVRGSLLLVAAICVLGALCFGGLGLLIAARPQTIEGASGLMNLTMIPMWVFSGVFFSSTNFPEAMQPAIQALPLTAVNDALRATLLEGAGLPALLPELLVIAAWTVGTFTVALRIFRWR